MSEKTAIHYYIPEDGDDIDHPNIFILEKEISSITLRDIRKAFPIPGTYFFRFKRSFKKSWIWFDVLKESEVVPSFEGCIICKVTRLPARNVNSKQEASIPVSNQESTDEPADFLNGFTSANSTKEQSSDFFDPFVTSEESKPKDPFSSLHFFYVS